MHQIDELPLPPELRSGLQAHGIEHVDETALRQTLEQQIPGYTLYRLTPAAAKRWKCRYRLMCDLGYYDGQSAPEAYARTLLAVLEHASAPAPSEQASPSEGDD